MSENGFVATEPSRASWGFIFNALKSWRRWLFNDYRFVTQFEILRHEIANHFHSSENIRFETASLKMRFPLRFKHFSLSGNLFKNFLRRLTFIHASRTSWELIFDALKSWERWLFNACRFSPQLAKLLRKMAKRIRAFFDTK